MPQFAIIGANLSFTRLVRAWSSRSHRGPVSNRFETSRQKLLSNTIIVAAALVFTSSAPTLAAAAPGLEVPNAQSSDTRPYDSKLLRLAELLGSVHYLRELCGANEGQFWRDTMQELIKSEGSSAERRSRLTLSFNNGYRSYSRTYNVCTPTARAAIERFLAEGAEIADGLIATAK